MQQKTIKMHIDPGSVSFLIGRKGSSVSSIRARSKAVVSFQEGGVTILRGTAEQCETAKRLIEEKEAEWRVSQQPRSSSNQSPSISRCASQQTLDNYSRFSELSDNHAVIEFLVTPGAETWLKTPAGQEAVAAACKTEDGSEEPVVAVYTHVIRIRCPTETLYAIKDRLHAAIVDATSQPQPWPTTIQVKRHTAHQNHGADPPDGVPLVRVVHIPNGSERVLIGQGGRTVQGIRDQTETTVRFDHGWAIVKGSAGNVRAALALIIAKLDQAGRPDSAKGKRRIPLPLFADRYLVGPRAATLRRIREQTGVTIRVEVFGQSSDVQPGTVVLTGPADNVVDAEGEISEMLCDFAYVTLPIIQSLIGRIIGRNGENLKRLVKLANNDVALFLPSNATGDKFAVIAGPADTVASTRRLFISRMALLQSPRAAMALALLPPRRGSARTPRTAAYSLVPHVDDPDLPSAVAPLGMETPRMTPPPSPAPQESRNLFDSLSSRLETIARQQDGASPILPSVSLGNVYGVTPYGASMPQTPAEEVPKASGRAGLVQYSLEVAEEPIHSKLFNFDDHETDDESDMETGPDEACYFADDATSLRKLDPGEKTVSVSACWFDAAMAGPDYWAGAVGRALAGLLGVNADSGLVPSDDTLAALPPLEVTAYIGKNVINIMESQTTMRTTQPAQVAEGIKDRRFDARFWAGIGQDAVDRLQARLPLPGDVDEADHGSFHVTIAAADATVARSDLICADLMEGDVDTLPDALVINRRPLAPKDRVVWRQIAITRHVHGITGATLSGTDLAALRPTDQPVDVAFTGPSAQILVAVPHTDLDVSIVIRSRPRVVPNPGPSSIDALATAANSIPLGCVFQTTSRPSLRAEDAAPVVALPLPDLDLFMDEEDAAALDSGSEDDEPVPIQHIRSELMARAAVGEQEMVPFEEHAILRYRKTFTSRMSGQCVAFSQVAQAAGCPQSSVNVSVFKSDKDAAVPKPAAVQPSLAAVTQEVCAVLRTAIMCAEAVARN